MKDDGLSQADRDFLANQLAASRRRTFRLFVASAVAGVILVVLGGGLALAAISLGFGIKLVVVAFAPGLVVASIAYQWLHPDRR